MLSDDGPWYDAMVVGAKYLASMMKNISIDAELSFVYTNHSLRATSVTVLDNSGVEARHIMSVSGHRSENSSRSYSRTDVEMKRKISAVLSSYQEPNESVSAKRALTENQSLSGIHLVNVSDEHAADHQFELEDLDINDFNLGVFDLSQIAPQASAVQPQSNNVANHFEQLLRPQM